MFQPAPENISRLSKEFASRLLMGGVVTLITSNWQGRNNVMPLAWHMPVSSNPTLIAIAVAESRYSIDMINHSEEFVINIPKRPMLHHVQYLGQISGENIDKLEAAQWDYFAGFRVMSPLLYNCAGWIECGVRHMMPFGDHVLYIAEVVSVQVDNDSFDLHWKSDVDDNRPLIYLGDNAYSSFDIVKNARTPKDLEAPEKILAERMIEELELTKESIEKREEIQAKLEREVELGNIIDVDTMSDFIGLDENNQLDFSQALIIDEQDKEDQI